MLSAEHFVRYVLARREERMLEFAFRDYVADALFTLLENDGSASKKCFQKRFSELLYPSEEKKAQDIIAELKRKGAIEVSG